jgi:flagellar operon protein
MSKDRFDILMPRVRQDARIQNKGRTDRQVQGQEAGEFAKVLAQVASQGGAKGRVKFSAHAIDRIQSRGIGLDIDEVRKVEEAIDQLDAKGGKQGLVLMERASLVVSVETRTVITAVDRGDEDGRVFTNIDSAVVVR